MEFDNPVSELVHLYVDGAFGRRELIERVAKMTGSIAAAMLALGGYEELQAQATPVPPGIRTLETDPDIIGQDVTYSGIDGRLFGYLVAPRNQREELPGVIVIHENRGLVEHIRDVTRRVAKAGYVALGIDLLSRQGGTAQFTEATAQTAAYNRTTQDQRRADIIASLDYLKKRDNVVYNRIGLVGFCAGGGNIWDVLTNVSEFAAAVPFYGPQTLTQEDIGRIQTPTMPIVAERDRTITQNSLNAAGLLSRAQRSYAIRVYEGVGHAFHNDTGAAYNAVAAQDAWAQSIAWFNRFLKA